MSETEQPINPHESGTGENQTAAPTQAVAETDPVTESDIDPQVVAPTELASRMARRHDLDALRAIAMLMGILLHGALAYVPMQEGGWAVQDINQSKAFAVAMAMVHGFRMPLFFLISGFFTAMLWRKRGLKALMWHRTKRILLPLVLGTFTIVPAVWISVLGANAYIEKSNRMTGIWRSVQQADFQATKEHINSGIDLDQREPRKGMTALTIAMGNKDVGAKMAELLVAGGADVNARNVDGTTALHDAALLGNVAAFEFLINAGADPTLKDRLGEDVAQKLQMSWGRTYVAAGMRQKQLAPEATYENRLACAAMIVDDVDQLSIGSGNPQLAGLWLMATLFPVFHHLWFLYFLCWLVLAFALYALIAQRTSFRLPRWMIVSPLRYAWLIPLTFLPQTMMGVLYPNFGPDTTTGLMPGPEILFYYAIFFFFGAFYYDADDKTGTLGRFWPVTLALALAIVFPIGYDMVSGNWGFTDRWLTHDWFRYAAVAMQVLYVWLMTFGLMGMFRRLFANESPAMRYISDSSYWLYLIHLPVMVVMQAAIYNWPIPALVKFTLICLVTTVMLLISYRYCVRYTPIGTLLNGKRERPERSPIEATLAGPPTT